MGSIALSNDIELVINLFSLGLVDGWANPMGPFNCPNCPITPQHHTLLFRERQLVQASAIRRRFVEPALLAVIVGPTGIAIVSAGSPGWEPPSRPNWGSDMMASQDVSSKVT
jgi:hypothetical protein